MDVIGAVAEHFPLLTSYYRLPEHHPALTREDLHEVVNAMFPPKKK